MKKILSLLLTIVLIGTVVAAPVSAQSIGSSHLQTEEIADQVVPVAYTSDFAGYSNVVGTLNSDGTKTAYIFASAEDVARVDSITGLPTPETSVRGAISTGGFDNGLTIASVYSSNPNTCYGENDFIDLGTNYGGGYARTYMKLDVTPLYNQGISYKDILSACVHFAELETEPLAVMESYLVKSSWDESTITWNNRPDYYNGELIGNMNMYAITGDDSDILLDLSRKMYITKAVMAWLQGMANNGILLKEKEDQYINRFYSEDYPSVIYSPYVTITYSDDTAPSGQGVVSGEKYYIVNRATEQCITAFSSAPNSFVHLSDGYEGDEDYQQWKVTATPDGKYTITLADTNYALESTRFYFSGTPVNLNNTGINNTWVFERNWNGSYRILPPGVNTWGFVDGQSSGLMLDSYSCNFDYSDEWTLYPVSQGTAALFDFYVPEDIDTTTYTLSVKTAIEQLGHTATNTTNAHATTGFSALQNSDYYIYNGHGLPGTLHFYNAQNGWSELTVSGQDENSLHLLSPNALAKQRFVLLSSCYSGEDYQQSNLVGKMYWLGAHNILSHYHKTGSNSSTIFNNALLSGVFTGKSVQESLTKAMSFYYDNPYADQYTNYEDKFDTEVHIIGNSSYRPCFNMANQYLRSWGYEYKNRMQLAYKVKYTGNETVQEKRVTTMDGTLVEKQFSLPTYDGLNATYDVYTDEYGGVYWYYPNCNKILSYEPFVGNLSVGETIVNPLLASHEANAFLQASGFDVTGYSITTSNAYSKTYKIIYQNPTQVEDRITVYLQADPAGNVYITKFAAYDYRG